MSHVADADVIVVGAGHNSLIAAGYLATAGKRVLVLERNSYPGGGVASAELAETGFLDERHSLLHIRILANPLITKDELGLQSRHGLEYIHLDKPYSAVFEDGSYIPICRDRSATLARLEQFSPRDAVAYDRFMAVAGEITDLLNPGFFVPPVAPHRQAAVLRRSQLGRAVLRATKMSVADVLGEWFSDERLLITLSRLASELSLAHPKTLNTGLIAYLAPGLIERCGVALPRGGGSAFTRACVRCITDLGGEVRTSVEVSKVITENGQAVGVRTSGGEQLRAAEAVLASIHPHRLSRFVDGLDPGLVRAASRTKLAPYTAFVVHASLDEPLHFKAGAEIDGIVWNTLSATSLGKMNEAFDELSRGHLPTVPLLEAGCPSVADESRAPAGKAVLHMLCLSVHNLADGGPRRWDQLRDKVADALLERLSHFATNFTRDSVRARALVTPIDHELSTPTFAQGDYTGIGSFSHQMGGLRPTKELSQYAVPGVHGLYLAGAFMHPGGGVTGGGRATAIRILEDMKLARRHLTADAQTLA